MIPGKRLEILENIPLAPFTTFKIGGPARFFIKAEDEQQVIDAFDFANSKQLKIFILGGGSNILVADAGFDGVVLQIALRGISPKPFAAAGDLAKRSEFGVPSSELGPHLKLETLNSEPFLQPPVAGDGSALPLTSSITSNAGEDWDSLVKLCVENDLAGIECLSGIPGLVGGTPVQNVGAYGQEVSETIVKVRCFDRTLREIVELTNAECGFGYRTSIFNTTHRDKFIVLSVTFALTRFGEPKIVYQDLREMFSDSRPDGDITLAETRNAVLRIRAAKSMVISKNDPNSRSAGSFFKNPIVEKAKTAEMRSKLKFANVPFYRVNETHVKIPAAWLIENAGFQKGYTKGKVGLSTNHTLAIVNLGFASANEIVDFMTELQLKVKSDFDIDLIPEPVFVGFDTFR